MAGHRFILTAPRLTCTALLAGALGLLPACDETAARHRYTVLTGSVLSCNAATGELTVQTDKVAESRLRTERVYCVTTKDSELYVNDKFAALGEIRRGDAIEVVGYREPDRRLESFVVGYAYVERPEPPAVVPALLREVLAPTSAPAPPVAAEASD